MSGFAAKEMHATQCVTMIEECLTETPVPPLEVLMMLCFNFYVSFHFHLVYTVVHISAL